METLDLLRSLSDESNAAFQCKLTPGIDRERFLGVRLPDIRALARKIANEPETEAFLNTLPHFYFDENMLHGVLIPQIKDFSACVAAVERFLPFVDNWAVCDTILPAAFARNKALALPYAKKWLRSPHTYTCRFGIGTLMRYYLNDGFTPDLPALVASVRSDEYYIKMMAAWYFATALAKQWESVIPFIENRALDDWTHNKTIQKARESFRVTPEHKEYLKTLKV
ncbi:MAG: DNA alkylation repair protein [Clostridia bacterium]|nr:DNA alkylation repair protein [Clostridia bacterium]